ncbi:MAG: DsbA family protein [Acidimicrobiia bacterium]|nr:DsbA family protein [Acidimicrobiia bacterium]
MTAFAITWDYRCPFARNAHEHVLAGLAAGADWDVTFVPFSLGQVHVGEGEAPIWDRPDDDSGLFALQVGTVVRDAAPEAFPAVHNALFAVRHDRALDLRDADVIGEVLGDHGVDAEATFERVSDGGALDLVRKEHEAAARDHNVWGVPTFVLGDRAAFVRLMDRPGDDGEHARRSVDRVLELLDGFAELNELKHTSVPR